jgi:hypothetical protein
MRVKCHRAILAALLCCALLAPCGLPAAELSDAEIDGLFKRHSDAAWKALDSRWDAVKARMTTPIENLSLPLETYPNGMVRARLNARRSQIFEDGTVFASGVKVILYSDTGAVQGSLSAGDCIFEKEGSHGYSRGNVEVQYGTDTLKGVGMYFSISGEYIKILSDCEIRTRRFQLNLGRLL